LVESDPAESDQKESDPAERDLLERDLPRPGMVSILVGGPTKRGVLVGMN